MRAAFEKWFVKYKVDLVFAGHVHAYERSVSSSIQHSVLHWNFRAVDMLSMVRISWICSFGVELGIWMLISHGYRIIYLQYRISNVNYNITSGNRYPVPDKSAPVYITVGDGGNQEGLASRWEEIARKLIIGTISFIELLHPSGLAATRFGGVWGHGLNFQVRAHLSIGDTQFLLRIIASSLANSYEACLMS